MTGHRAVGLALLCVAGSIIGCSDLRGPAEPLDAPAPPRAPVRPAGGPSVLLGERMIAPGSNPDISGTRIAYECGLGDICVHDLATGLSRQLTGAAHQQGPVIDGDRVVYRDTQRGIDIGTPNSGPIIVEDLTLYDLASETEEIIVFYVPGSDFGSPREWADGPPSIGAFHELAGRFLVYESRHEDIAFYDVMTRAVIGEVAGAVNNSSFGLHRPTISQDWVAFEAGPAYCAILAFRVSAIPFGDVAVTGIPGTLVEAGTFGPCSQRPTEPAVDGNLLAFVQNATGGGDIAYNFLPGVDAIAAGGPARQSNPHVSGNRIVWQDARNGNLDIYMRDLSTGVETQITSDPQPDHSPRIDGDRIVWQRDIFAGGPEIYMRAFNQMPVAMITSPPEGAQFFEGDGIAFEGSGADFEDGALGGASLQWTSDVSGEIGIGTSFVRSDLPIGFHTITLQATDSHGSYSTTSVQIEVVPAPGPSTVEEWLDLLEAKVLALRDDDRLDDGGADKLLHRIRKAREALAQGKDWKVVLELELFIDRVDKLVRAGDLDADGAADLVDTAESIINAVEGG